MHKSPVFTLILGLLVGVAVGYVLAERQAVPPARAAAVRTQGTAVPQGHPPIPGQAEQADAAANEVDRRIAEVQNMLAQSPQDHRLMIMLGDINFDAGRWQEARTQYERALELGGDDVNVLTDLGVVYRNLAQPEAALGLFDRAIAMDPAHWKAWYNKVVVLNGDLHRHDEARTAFARLQQLAASNPEIPDLSGLERGLGAHQE